MSSKPFYKKKWVIAVGVIFALALLLPAVIGKLLRSQINQQLALQQQSPVWDGGWWSSRMRNTTAGGAEMQINFQHGPVWLNPLDAGITRLNGELRLQDDVLLPLTGQVGLGGGYLLKQIIPVGYFRAGNHWDISPVASNAYLQVQGSLGGQTTQINLKYPQGMLRPGEWQLSWQDVLSQLQLVNANDPLQSGDWEMQIRTLRLQPQLGLSGQHILRGLDATLNWPENQDIELQLNATDASLIGQPQATGELQLSARAVSIDRQSLVQWLQAGDQNNPAANANRALTLAGLLAAHPELLVEKLQLNTPEGLIELQAHLKFKPGQREARVTGSMPTAAAHWLAEGWLVDEQTAREQVQSMIQNGLLRRDGERLIVDLVVNL